MHAPTIITASALWLASIAGTTLGQTITVDSSDDFIDFGGAQQVADLPGPDGKVTLAEAALASDNTPGVQTIAFNIPQSDWQFQWLYPGRAVIRPSNPRFFQPVILDATTQTAFTGDTNPDGGEVVIWATLRAIGGNSVVKGFDSTPISVIGSNNIVEQNTGIASIDVFDGENNIIRNNTITSTIKIDRSNYNIIIGNTAQRVRIWGFAGGSGSLVAVGNRLGGPTLAERNYITGYGTVGEEGFPQGTTVQLFDTEDTIIENNWIGIKPNGMEQGNLFSIVGIGFEGVNNGTIVRNNRIAGILGHGQPPHAQGLLFGDAIQISGTGGNISITGNTIGLNANDEPVLGSVTGINVLNDFEGPVQGVTIGGPNPEDANTIAGHLLDGVAVHTPVMGVDITGNSIFANSVLGIDLLPLTGAIGPTPNDPLDPDQGGNGLQNFPVLDSASVSAAGTHVAGQLDSRPNANFRIEVFANPECNPSGFGQGQMFLGSFNVSTDPLGVAAFDETLPVSAPAGWVVSSTATELASGSTSEFSACIAMDEDPACPADLNGDGVLDLVDINLFVTGFTANDPIADLNVDGIYDLGDVQAFIESFTSGCP